MTRATHFGLHPWQGWKRPMSTAEREPLAHGRFSANDIRTAQDISNGLAVFYVRNDRDSSRFRVILSEDGVDLQTESGDYIHFGGASEFDELCDLITFLHGKAAEVAK